MIRLPPPFVGGHTRHLRRVQIPGHRLAILSLSPHPAIYLSNSFETSSRLLKFNMTTFSQPPKNMLSINPENRNIVGVQSFTPDAIAETSRLLQQNHDQYHVFFNEMGFHNHIPHHLVTLYALGATPEQLKLHFERNTHYQRDIKAGQTKPSAANSSVATYEGFIAGFSQQGKYAEYLAFFSEQIEKRGVNAVLDEYLLAKDERAQALFSRLNAGVIHPMIHFGLATEFQLPGMVAESLAWAAMHADELAAVPKALEQKTPVADTSANLIDLFRELNKHAEVARGALAFESYASNRYDNFLKMDNGAVVDILARYRVDETNVEARIYEAINVQTYVTLASTRRSYIPKFDFFLIHGSNATVFLPSLLEAYGPKRAAVLLEHLVRACMLDYLMVGAPDFNLDWTMEFVAAPNKQNGKVYADWNAIFARANELLDEGHIAKGIRALYGAHQNAHKQTSFAQPLPAEDILGLAGVFVRSVEDDPDFVVTRGLTEQWVRKAGFEAAWQGYAKVA